MSQIPKESNVRPIHLVGQEDEAARVAIQWLEDRHRKGWERAFRELLDDWRGGAPIDADAPLDEDGVQMLAVNAGEWLLARGQIHARGGLRNIADHLLGREGPWLTPGQQRWIAQLRDRPLRLYRVTDVRLGEGLTLIDELDAAAEPVDVREISGSRSATPGLLLGARLMQVGEPPAAHFELSGAIYPFSALTGPGTVQAVRDATAGAQELGLHADNVRDLAEMEIARRWLAQWIAAPVLPQIRDAGTGEAMLLVTDHYRVLDAAALATNLAAQPDVSGNATAGWHRDQDLGDGTKRSLAAINPGKAPGRIEVFYRTQGLADAGRAWFEGAAGATVAHLTREIVDPAGAATRGTGGRAPSPDLDPQQMAELVDKVMMRHYANWCDEPIPALRNQTPRQAIGTPAGLERVKGLLREYEAGERQSSAEQGREPFSFQFLWDALGIPR